jgi:hypothetical protein
VPLSDSTDTHTKLTHHIISLPHYPTDIMNGIPDMNGRRADDLPQTNTDDLSNSIAIVGISCKFGGAASNLDGLWHTLSSGESCWSPVPKNRFDISKTSHPDSLRTDSVRITNFLESMGIS